LAYEYGTGDRALDGIRESKKPASLGSKGVVMSFKVYICPVESRPLR
jgi:hypothetical protein